MNHIDAVTLDAYGTIVESGRVILLDVCRQIARDLSLPISGEEFMRHWDGIFFGLDAERFYTLREASDLSLQRALKAVGYEADTRPYVKMLEEGWRNARPYPEVREVLEELDDFPLCIVSNADHDFLLRLLERGGLHFDKVVTSESCRAYKPQTRIFQSALELLGTRPERTLHAGDSLDADVLGAKRAGLKAAWVNRLEEPLPPSAPRPDYVIRDLRGLKGIL